MSFNILQISQTNIVAPTTGAQLRNYYLAAELAKIAHVSHLGFQDEHDSRLKQPDPRNVPITLIRKEPSYTFGKLILGALGRKPAGLLNFSSSEMTDAIRAELQGERDYDVVQVEGIEMSLYLDLIRQLMLPGKILVMDWHNVESELLRRHASNAKNLFQRLYLLRAASQFRQVESRILELCDLNLVTSARERIELLHRRPGARVMVIENGVSTERFSGVKSRCEDRAAWHCRHRVLFVGSMDYRPNIEAASYFASEIWPLLQRERQGLKFTVVGRNPPKEVRDLADTPGIEVTGTVADVRKYYDEAIVAVVPLRIGGGTRLKILEAMAAGVPVVSTALGAEGLAVQSDVHIDLAETPNEFKLKVSRLCDDYSRWKEISVAGSELVKARYDWRVICGQLRKIYLNLLKSDGGDYLLPSIAGL